MICQQRPVHSPPPSHLQHLDDVPLSQGAEVHRERISFLADLDDAASPHTSNSHRNNSSIGNNINITVNLKIVSVNINTISMKKNED